VEDLLAEQARDALAKRHIELAWLKRAVTTPKASEADPHLEHRLARIPEFGDRVL
jgi:hypothetical protein